MSSLYIPCAMCGGEIGSGHKSVTSNGAVYCDECFGKLLRELTRRARRKAIMLDVLLGATLAGFVAWFIWAIFLSKG
jgi:hypothetical protein